MNLPYTSHSTPCLLEDRDWLDMKSFGHVRHFPMPYPSDGKESERTESRSYCDLLQTQERERSLIAYEIHDSPTQHLVAAAMQLDVCKEMLEKDMKATREALAEGRKMLDEALAELRRLIAGLSPPQLEEMGVVAAIRTLVEGLQSPPEIRFECDVRFERLQAPAENSFFRMVQESLTNAIRHSHSETVTVRLTQSEKSIHIEIRDDGVGFWPEEVKSDRFGLKGIRQRASVFGGRAKIYSAPGFGTRVTVELPSSLIVE